MGHILSTIWDHLSGVKRNVRILMVGLDAAGKSTLLYKLKLGDVVTTIPTIGFNVDTVEHKNINFTVWDVGGQDKIRALWRNYYKNNQGLIFVIDSNDRDRIDEARDELLNKDELRKSVVLIYANKQDISNAMSSSEMIERLGLNKYSNRKWAVFACSARHGYGLYEGLDWLSRVLYYRRN